MNIGATRSAKKQAKCAHLSTIDVRSHRIERRICEDCAYVSFSITEDELVYGRRDKFARETDSQLELVS